jgi:hypothetical protein
VFDIFSTFLQVNELRTCVAALLLLCCGLVCQASAQAGVDDSRPLGRWNAGVFFAGGNGLNDRRDVHMVRAGGRIGRVLTREHKYGSFEVGAEIMPVDYTLWEGYKDVYGFGANPVMLKWDFPTHAGNKVAGFLLTQSGFIYSADKIPPGDTSNFNFTTGIGVGMHIFTRPARALTLDMRAVHLSNASIGNHNPGINASLQFSLGYTWFKH